MIQLNNYIDGRQVPPKCNAYLDNFEPATGQVYSRIPDSDQEDVALAYAAAKAARCTPPIHRWAILATTP